MAQRFELRAGGVSSGLTTLVGAIPLSAAVLGIWHWTADADLAVWTRILVSGLPLLCVPVMFGFVAWGMRGAQAQLEDGFLVFGTTAREGPSLPLEKVATLNRREPPALCEIFMPSEWFPVSLYIYADVLRKPTLQVSLNTSVPHRSLRIRTISFEPKDRAAFIAALRQVAPHVTIEPSLVE